MSSVLFTSRFSEWQESSTEAERISCYGTTNKFVLLAVIAYFATVTILAIVTYPFLNYLFGIIGLQLGHFDFIKLPIGIVVFLAGYVLFTRFTKGNLQKAYGEEREVLVSVGEDGLVIKEMGICVSVDWNAVTNIYVKKKSVKFLIGISLLGIPRRAFENDESMKAFAIESRNYFNSSKSLPSKIEV